MTVEELIKQLEQIKDQTQTVECTDGGANFEIIWVDLDCAEIKFQKIYR